jgi:hypothetical protein
MGRYEINFGAHSRLDWCFLAPSRADVLALEHLHAIARSFPLGWTTPVSWPVDRSLQVGMTF